LRTISTIAQLVKQKKKKDSAILPNAKEANKTGFVLFLSSYSEFIFYFVCKFRNKKICLNGE